MSRVLVVLLFILGSVVGPLGRGIAVAADPEQYHTIELRHADASFVIPDAGGCLHTDIWVSSSVGSWAPASGTTHRQGLTSVDIFVIDDCAVPEIGVKAGGGGTVLALWHVETLEPLVAEPNLSGASFASWMTLVDEVSGAEMVAMVDLAWTPAGPIDHYTVSLGEHWTQAGMVHGTTNAKIRDAAVTGSIVVQGVDLLDGSVGAGNIERTKWVCIENRHPHADGDIGSCVLGG